MKPTSKSPFNRTQKPAVSSTGGKRGNMKPTEIRPLVMAARKAWDRQSEAGLVEDGETFDTWRHRQCMEVVSKPGITSCLHDDFRPLLAHFQTLAGDDASAFATLMKSGKSTDHAAPGDTHEARSTLAHQIAEALAAHAFIAEADPVSLDANQLARRTEIDQKGKGPVGVGYLVWIVRAKTRRPDLQLGRDWQAGLAERCTVRQLAEIRSTIINRIAAVEGTGDRRNRNKSQRGATASADRSPGELAPRLGVDSL